MKRWPLHNAYFWEAAPFFRVLLPFAGGIVGYELTRPYFVARISSISFLLAALIAYFLIFFARKQRSYFRPLNFLLHGAILFTAGYALSMYDDVRNDRYHFSRCANKGEASLVRITGTPAEREKTWKIPVTVLASIDSNKTIAVTGKAYIYVHKSNFPLRLQKGDSVLVPGNWQPIKTSGNPFEFDYATYCRRNGIIAQQFCSRSDIATYGRNNPSANPLTERAHDWCMRQLDTFITGKKARGLMQAMLLGDEVNLDEELRDAYADTGIIHIIAISGGNVAIFFIVISFLLRWLKNKRYEWVKYLIAFPMVWFYVIMAGSSPSAIRAAMMFSLLAIGIMWQKNNNSLNQLFATAFVLLCAEPMWLFAAGFQLSFVAVLSIILFYGPIYRWLKPKYWITKQLWGTVAASLAAEILVAPMVIYYFHNFPAMFLVANVAAYIFMGVVLILGICVVVLSPLAPVATLLGCAIEWLVNRFGYIVSWLQQFNPVSFRFLAITAVEMILLYTVIAGASFFLMRKIKTALYTGLGAMVILLIALCFDEWQALRQERLVVYNTGGSNCVELIKGKYYHTLVQDTGNAGKIFYATNPAHIQWHAWHKGSETGEVFTINGKTAILLNEATYGNQQFAADIAIINYRGNVEPAELKKTFALSTVVIGNSIAPKQREQIKMKCESAGITCYSVSEKGAFVLN